MNPELNTTTEQNLVLGLQELAETTAIGGIATPDMLGLHSDISIFSDCSTGEFQSSFCTI